MISGTATQEPGWPLRTWALMVLGALFALAVQQLTDLPDSGWEWGKRLVGSAIVFLIVGGISFGLSWRQGRGVPAAIMAAVCGLIAGGVMLWNGTSGGSFDYLVWPMCSGVVASAVFLVLYQAADARHPHLPATWSWAGLKDWKRQTLVYADVHEAAWTDALLGGMSGIFTGIVVAIAFLLAEMFHLVKIDLLRELLRKEWAIALLFGAAYGGGMGLLRDRQVIISLLQRVAMIVLRVLAPVLAVGLVAFLAVLPFTGLAPLWATGETTPAMLGASLVALFLVNAVIGDKAEDAALSRPLRWGAMALALALLPLVAICAWSTGLRIGQHGLSPDRLWAVTFIILAAVTVVAYAVAILRRGDWVARLYRSNLHLAFILGGVALILSTSIVGFDRLATADQLARLNSGKIKPVDFDYRGLWFDFGPPGKAAIKQLAKSAKDATVRKFAGDVQKLGYRFEDAPNDLARHSGDELDKRLTIIPRTVILEPMLRKRLTDFDACRTSGPCTLRYVPGDDYAITLWMPEGCKDCQPDITLLDRGPRGDWGKDEPAIVVGPSKQASKDKKPSAETLRANAVREGKVEMREVRLRQLYIDGAPYGAPIRLENAAEP
ncbi:MAG: DUF4153 domain-containing protein [Sphingobium sp.]|nr:DUF4153 domain-containing protein [Sphingobium sp.]